MRRTPRMGLVAMADDGEQGLSRRARGAESHEEPVPKPFPAGNVLGGGGGLKSQHGQKKTDAIN